jgi:hypothetical protein
VSEALLFLRRKSTTTTVCDPNAAPLTINVDKTQAALASFSYTAIGQGTDVLDSDCGKGSSAGQSQCVDLTPASPMSLNLDCGFAPQ